MKAIERIGRLLKPLIRRFGLDLVYFENNPSATLLGLCDEPIRTILDIGANEGQSAVRFRRLFPEALIYCFEPVPTAYDRLQNRVALQDNKILAFNVALGNRSGTALIHHHLDHSPSSSLLGTTETLRDLYPETERSDAVEVTITKLDSLLPELELRPEILVKIDVQGYEWEVIRGAREVLQKSRACLVEVGMQNLYDGQCDFDDLYTELRSLGLNYAGNLRQRHDPAGRVSFIDAVFSRVNP